MDLLRNFIWERGNKDNIWLNACDADDLVLIFDIFWEINAAFYWTDSIFVAFEGDHIKYLHSPDVIL